MGQCLYAGWSEKQFWKSSYRAVYNLIYTVQKREEAKIHLSWEQIRTLCDFVIAPYKKTGQSGRAFDLPWDPGMEPVVDTPEKAESREKFYNKIDRLMQRQYAQE